MRGTQLPALALALCTVLASCNAQQGVGGGSVAWIGEAASAAASKAGYGPFAGANPFKFLSMLADMPPKEQRMILAVAGEGLKQQLGLECNIFGGAPACQPLPPDSAFAKQCKGRELQVDCAYVAGLDGDALDFSALDTFKESLEPGQLRDIQDGCPRCFSNLQAMWCAQSVPKCGSFESVVEVAVLPALTKATDAAEGGKGVQAALAAALPELLDAVGLSLPCREMCESVMATCACGDEPGHKFQTFGHLIEEVLEGYQSSSALARIPRGFSQTMFGKVYDRPLCSLFAWRNATGFAGTCEPLPSTCLEKKWCKAGGGGPNAFEQHMALQLAKTVFGWVGAPDGPGLFETQQAIIDKADDADIKRLSDKYLRHQGAAGALATSGGLDGEEEDKVQKAFAWILHALSAVKILTLGMIFGIILAAVGVDCWHRRQARAAAAAERADYAGIPLAESGAAPAGSGDNRDALL